MSEAQECSAVLDDVDASTFIRFSQWAYFGYYEPRELGPLDVVKPTPAPIPKMPVFKALEELEKDEEEGAALSLVIYPNGSSQWQHRDIKDTKKAKTSHKKFQRPKDILKEDFFLLKYPTSETSHSPLARRANRGPTEYHTEVFLSHAQLYVFAERYDIQPLKALAIHQLHATLALFTLYKERIVDIEALLRYTYANTADLEGDTDQLRVMLMLYVATEIDILINADEFTRLLEEGGSLLHDVLKVVRKRLS